MVSELLAHTLLNFCLTFFVIPSESLIRRILILDICVPKVFHLNHLFPLCTFYMGDLSHP